MAMSFSVGPRAESSLGMDTYDDDDMELRVWESVDESLVVAIASSGRPGKPCHVTVAAGPSSAQPSSGSVRFTLATSVPVAQCWFFIASTSQLVVHVGSSLLLFSLYSLGNSAPFHPQSARPWYHASEFPVDVAIESPSSPAADAAQFQSGLELTFDIESFLRHVLDASPALCVFHLQDYDLRHLCMADQSWMYVSVVVALEQSNPTMPRRRRVGIFVAWNVCNGEFRTLRVLSVPTTPPLASAATALAAKCRRDIRFFHAPSSTSSSSTHGATGHVAAFTMWTNLGVLSGASLHRLDNPVFPYAISRR